MAERERSLNCIVAVLLIVSGTWWSMVVVDVGSVELVVGLVDDSPDCSSGRLYILCSRRDRVVPFFPIQSMPLIV